MPKLVRREAILAKVETTYNTDAAPSPATDAILVENLAWSLEGLRKIERNPLRGSLASLKSIYGGTLASVSFDMEMKGSGTAGSAPEMGVILRACGLKETIVANTSVSYSPASMGHESVTLWLYEDGTLLKLTGCRGTLSLNLETGEKGMANVSLTGHLSSHSDSAFPSFSYDDTTPAPLIHVPFKLGLYSAVISSLSIDLGNEIATPPSLSAVDGFGEVRITARNVSGSFDPEASLISEQDYLADLQSDRELGLTCGDVGSQAGNRFSLNLPAISYQELSQGDRDGTRTYEVGFAASEVQTDDEMTIEFK